MGAGKGENYYTRKRGLWSIPRGRFGEAWRCWGIMKSTNEKGKEEAIKKCVDCSRKGKPG